MAKQQKENTRHVNLTGLTTQATYMEMLKPHLGNYGASVTGQSVWRERKGSEEDVSKIEREIRKNKREFKPTWRLKPEFESFCLSSPAFKRCSGQPLTSLLILLCHRWNKYFLISSFSRGLGSQVRLILSWQETWVLAYVSSIAKTTQTVSLFSIKGGYSSVLSINSTAVTVPLPSSSSTKSHRKYNTIFNFHLPQVGLSFKTKFLSAGLKPGPEIPHFVVSQFSLQFCSC